MPSKVYWDACCFIGLLQDEPDKAAALQDLAERARAGEIQIVTSALCIAEVCKLPNTTLSPEVQAERILAFFENPFIVVRSLDRLVAERASRIVRQHPIKPPDAIHLATGVVTQCEVFYTYDSRQNSSRGLLRYNGVDWLSPMRVEQPAHPASGTLFQQRD